VVVRLPLSEKGEGGEYVPLSTPIAYADNSRPSA